MKSYVVVGKRGSSVDIITRRVSELIRDVDISHCNPKDINYADKDTKIIYIHIPFSAAWDWIMYGDIHNQEKLSLFYDEIMDFRALDRVDYQVEFDGGVDWRSIASRIIRIIQNDKE